MDSGESSEHIPKLPYLTLDLAGLSESQRQEGLSLLGGDAAEFVERGDEFAYSEVKTVVFRWGDPRAADVFAAMFEHSDQESSLNFPFNASTIVGNQVWMLAIQERDFDPETAYESPEQYILMPEDEPGAVEVVANLNPPGPELLGKIGNRWVSFEVGTSLESENHRIKGLPTFEAEDSETIPLQELFEFLHKMVELWEFDKQPLEETLWFTLQFSHWLIETFGQLNDQDDYFLYHDADGFDGEELPSIIRPLTMYTWKNEIYFWKDNELGMRTDHYCATQDESYLPEWEKVKDLPFIEMLNYYKQQPALCAGAKQEKVYIAPRVSLTLGRRFNGDSGLEFTIEQAGIGVYPYGRPRKNRKEVRFAFEHQDQIELAELACQLALLTAEKARPPYRGVVDREQLDRLADRLNGQSKIPIAHADFMPTSSMRSLVIEQLAKEGYL